MAGRSGTNKKDTAMMRWQMTEMGKRPRTKARRHGLLSGKKNAQQPER
jgi:hypothetical protein